MRRAHDGLEYEEVEEEDRERLVFELRLDRDRAQIARWETEGQEPSFSNLCAVIEACGYTLRVEIVEPEFDQALDTEIAQALQLAPQQRLQALIDQLEGSG